MKLEIAKERDTPLLSRKRVTLNLEYEGATPSRLDLKKAVAKKLGSKENLTIIRHVYTRFGKQKAKIIAHVYEKEEDMKAIEFSKVVSKHQEKEEKKEAAKEEAPVAA